MGRNAGKVIMSNIIGIIVFLILLGIANLLIPVVNNPTYMSVVEFFNLNLWFIVLLWFIGFINELFWSFYFPFNIIAPIISAVYSIFIIMFISLFWDFIKILININFDILFGVLYVIVPLIVLVAGYIIILVRLSKKKCYEAEKEKRKKNIERRVKEFEKEIDQISWDDVGDEYKSALFNLGKSINKLFEDGKDKKDKKKSVKKKSRKNSEKKRK